MEVAAGSASSICPPHLNGGQASPINESLMLFKHRGGNQPKLTSLVLESLEPEGLFTFHLFETELNEYACFFEFWDDFEL